VAVRHGFLLPVRVVMAVFRGKMVDAIRQTFARRVLALPEAMRPQQLVNLLNRLGHPRQTKWHVRIMERYRHGAGVVTYLARYLRGWPDQKRTPRGLGRRARHLQLSSAL
jgi:Putative transposase